MKISTTRFGDIEVEDSKKIIFPDGILGFENLKEYILIRSNDSSVFYWQQSIENSNIAIACMDPLNVCDNYSPVIDEDSIKELDIKQPEKVLVLCVVVIPKDIMKTTVNLAAPIIINTTNNRAKQIVLQDDVYSLRHFVFKQNEVV